MKGPILALLALLGLIVSGVAATSFAEQMERASNATLVPAKVLDDSDLTQYDAVMNGMKDLYTMEDFLAAPFDLTNERDLAVYNVFTRDAAAFEAFRSNLARTRYHMEYEDYAAQFNKQRQGIIDLSRTLGLGFVPHQVSYDALLNRCEQELAVQERAKPASFVEARAQVATLRVNAHLFAGRSTLHSLAVQDAVMHGVGSMLGKIFDKLVGLVQKNKCKWCKGVVNFVIKGGCKLFGKGLCKGLTASLNFLFPGAGVVADKFVCDFPISLSNVFASWCSSAVKHFMEKKGLSADCLCSFKIPRFVIPATKFDVLGITVFACNRRDINIGQVCPVSVGQCAGSTEAEKAKYKEQLAKEKIEKQKKQQAELLMIKKMTLKEKIAYHTKILKGQLKTNLSDAMIDEVLGAVTGLGKGLLKGLKAAGGELMKGNVKGAAGALVKEVAKDGAKELAKKALASGSKVVSSSVTKVVTSNTNAYLKTQVDRFAEAVGKAVASITVGVSEIFIVRKAAAIKAKYGEKAAFEFYNKAMAKAKLKGEKYGKWADVATKFAGNMVADVTTGAIGAKMNQATSNTIAKTVNKASGQEMLTVQKKEEKTEEAKKARREEIISRAAGSAGATASDRIENAGENDRAKTEEEEKEDPINKFSATKFYGEGAFGSGADRQGRQGLDAVRFNATVNATSNANKNRATLALVGPPIKPVIAPKF